MQLTRRSRLLLGSSVAVALAATALAADLVAGGSGGVIEGGPLGPPTNWTTSCLPLKPGRALTDGFDQLTNRGHQTAVIERVSPRSPRRLRMIGAFIVPADGTDGVGFWSEFPPPAYQLAHTVSGIEWADRERPRGARIAPGRTADIVIGLEPTSRQFGSTEGIDVRYRVGTQQYEFRTDSQVIIKVGSVRYPRQCRVSLYPRAPGRVIPN